MNKLVFLAASTVAVAMVIPIQQTVSSEPEWWFPQDVTVTEFSDDWGDGRSGGRRHQGTDLFAPKMTPVFAAADGTVARITSSARPGRYLQIDHGDGWATSYMHLNNDHPGRDDGRAPWWMTIAPGIEIGSEVRAGQHIAWVGDSGNAETSSAHTHFELHRHGQRVNPYPTLQEAFRRQLDRLELADRLSDTYKTFWGWGDLEPDVMVPLPQDL